MSISALNITEGSWTFTRAHWSDSITATHTDGTVVTAVDMPAVRRRVSELHRSPMRATIASGPGRAQCGHRRYTGTEGK
jgi:hypothetical protein